jgi:uncharacterized protein (DUF302 family)
MSEALTFEIDLADTFETALERVHAALKAEGFGILTTIDVRHTLKEKLGADFRRYVILGACNPDLAYQALQVRPDVGVLLPCTVTVEDRPAGGSRVRILNPAMLMGLGGLGEHPVIARVASEARGRLQRVAGELGTPVVT